MDRESGTLAPGSFRYKPNDFDFMQFESTASTVLKDCIRDQGFSGELDDMRPVDPLYAVDVMLPPWLEEHAERFAFFPPQPLGDLLANGVTPAGTSTGDLEARQVRIAEAEQKYTAFLESVEDPQYQSALATCEDDPEVKKWKDIKFSDLYAGPWTEEFEADWVAAFKDERMRPIKEEFAACLAESGLEAAVPDSIAYDDIFAVKGQSYETIDEQQITLAVTTVRCKDQVDAVARTMTIWAEYEAATYREYEQELNENLAELETMRADMEALWASRGA